MFSRNKKPRKAHFSQRKKLRNRKKGLKDSPVTPGNNSGELVAAHEWTWESLVLTKLYIAQCTILLYPKLPCICYRGIIELLCIFAGFGRFMPQILYMTQGNNWEKITKIEISPCSFGLNKMGQIYVEWYNKWQLLRYVPACSVRRKRYSKMYTLCIACNFLNRQPQQQQ